jgi:hypothetical protein
VDETEVSLSIILSAANTAAADFVSFTFPRVKFGSAAKDDGEKNLVQTLSFVALRDGTGGAGTDSEASTVVIQDSQA